MLYREAVASQSPGLRVRELPWVKVPKERVTPKEFLEIAPTTRLSNTFGVGRAWNHPCPRVARKLATLGFDSNAFGVIRRGAPLAEREEYNP